MSNQDFGRNSPANRNGRGQRTGKVENEPFSNASPKAGDAANKNSNQLASAAATVSDQVKQLFDRQVDSGADMMGHVAGAVKRVAQELDSDAPQLAGMVRTAAEQIDGYADGLRDQSVAQLMHSASDFTRRQPAVVFGLAALAGFFVLRTLKNTPSSVASAPFQPTDLGAGESHGA